MEKKVIHSDPDIMGGTPVFIGTRVPVSFMFDYLRAGASIEAFLDQYPSVSKNLAMAALNTAEQLVINDAHPA
ncbi:DUF433 domain-containing protein [Duganella sp. CT11-25]|jgi:uncharacterized protein (DUF433 family)|uniref:DUF433 domain-containing protein n=1 Tax=unclassified Duganella TaxID=2636909 RepID=UPI0039AF2B3F